MPMKFEFATSNKVVFGRGVLRQIGSLTNSFGRKPLFVTGSDPDRLAPVMERLSDAGQTVILFPVSGEPTVDYVMEGLEKAKSAGCDWVIAMGGGSVVDAGKAIAGLMNNPGDPLNYLEVVGKGDPLENPSAPFVAVPTTSGTGAEVTRNAVLSVPEERFKVSLRSPFLLPQLAVIDPEWTHSVPQYVKACSGLDALTQLLEPWVGCRGNWMTDAFCWEGLTHFRDSFRTMMEDPESEIAHDRMAMASLLSGMALANSGLGVIHGFAAPLGGMYNAPHGAICARLSGPGCRANIKRLQSDLESSQERDVSGGLRKPLERYQQAARLLLKDSQATEKDLVEWLEDLSEWAEIPRLKDLGVKQVEFSDIAEKALRSGSMKGNPVELPKSVLVEILESAF